MTVHLGLCHSIVFLLGLLIVGLDLLCKILLLRGGLRNGVCVICAFDLSLIFLSIFELVEERTALLQCVFFAILSPLRRLGGDVDVFLLSLLFLLHSFVALFVLPGRLERLVLGRVGLFQRTLEGLQPIHLGRLVQLDRLFLVVHRLIRLRFCRL